MEEHKFTSTGIKFWKHAESMLSYKLGTGNSVVSTHISPEGACNLKCPYCSVTYRDTHSRLDLDVIKDYVVKLTNLYNGLNMTRICQLLLLQTVL